jgi:hypothetical protein
VIAVAVYSKKSLTAGKMKSKTISYYSIFIGMSVIGLWIMILVNDQLPEGKTELTFHLVSEFIMAVLCLLSGILILMKKNIGKLLNISGLSMISYSVLNAAGYYGERDNLSMMILFIVLLFVTLIVLSLHLNDKAHG